MATLTRFGLTFEHDSQDTYKVTRHDGTVKYFMLDSIPLKTILSNPFISDRFKRFAEGAEDIK